jgi:hypothetical protein
LLIESFGVSASNHTSDDAFLEVIGMIGKRSAQMPLYDVGNVFGYVLKPGTFHAQLADAADRLFNDEDFAAFYSSGTGRPSVPPSKLALIYLMQAHAQVSDEEAVTLTGCDLRWASVLRTGAGEPYCAKSTLQLFRAHLDLHPEVESIFASSIDESKRAGLLQGHALRIAIDTKPISGRGSVQDTFNLVATGIRQLARALAKIAGQNTDSYLCTNGLSRYTEPSIKGSADIDWSDEQARSRVLTEIVVDAKRLLSIAGSHDTAVVRDAAKLLEQLMLQDIQTKKNDDGSEHSTIIDGTAKGRVPSATDPDVRHGRKSSSKRFNGHKADIAVDQESGTIVGFNVLAGDAADASGALALVEQVEHNTDMKVEETEADCAYGGGPTRQEFEDEGRVLVAKVPHEYSRDGLYPKSAFNIDLEKDTVTCPAGNITGKYSTDKAGKHFRFGSQCAACSLKSLCTKSKSGRTVTVHHKEAAIQEARRYQKTPEGRSHLRKRVVVEHRLARLAQLGIGQARYKGHRKTRLQLMIACAIANFRLAWNHKARMEAGSGQLMAICTVITCLTAVYRLATTLVQARLQLIPQRMHMPPQLVAAI